MKKLLLATTFLSLMSGSLFAMCKINKDTGEPMICVTKDQACVLLAALDCFSNRFKKDNSDIIDEEEVSEEATEENAKKSLVEDEALTDDEDVAELQEMVTELKMQIEKCCAENGGCKEINDKVCKLVK